MQAKGADRSRGEVVGGREIGLDLLVGVAPLALTYLLTLARDLGTIDSGELAVACARLGVAHPTGYALYTLLGRLFVLALPGPPIVALNLLSAGAGVAAGWFVLLLAREAIRIAGVERSLALAWVPRLAALWFGWDRVFWEQATGNEVYSLHLTGVACLLWLGLRLFSREPRDRTRWLLPYVAGLGAAHHLTVVFLAPALLWAWIERWIGRRARPTRRSLVPGLLAPIGLSLLAYSVVMYLPIRSSLGPVLDWGGTAHWATFWRHALAAQYRVWFFESAGQFVGNLTGYLGSLPVRILPLLLVLTVIGVRVLARTAGRAAVYLGLVAVVTLLWASSYDIHDLAPYFLPIDLVCVIFAAVGAAWLLARTSDRGSLPVRPRSLGGLLPRLMLPVLALATLLQAALPFRELDRRDDRFVRLHSEVLLESLPARTILVSRFWDAFVSPWIYLHTIEAVRPDVMVVDSELLRRSWYFPQLRRWDPTLLTPVEEQLRAFLLELALFESGKRYDPNSIESRYRALIAGLALAQRPSRPGAFTLDVLQDYSVQVQMSFFAPALPVPEGLCFVLRDRPEESPRLAPPDPARLFAAGYRPQDRIHQIVVEQWRFMLRSRTEFLLKFDRNEEAAEWEAAASKLETLFRPH